MAVVGGGLGRNQLASGSGWRKDGVNRCLEFAVTPALTLSRPLQENNAIGKLNLTDQFSNIVYHTLGRKDWSGLTFDGSYDDGGRFKFMHSLTSPRASYELFLLLFFFFFSFFFLFVVVLFCVFVCFVVCLLLLLLFWGGSLFSDFNNCMLTGRKTPTYLISTVCYM